MNRRMVSYLLSLILFSALVACTDLEENLRGEITKDFSNSDVVAGSPASYISVYPSLRYAGTANHGGYYTLQEVASDEMFIGAKGSDWKQEDGLIALHQHAYTPDNTFVQNAWLQLYAAIDDMNDLMGFSTSEQTIAAGRGVRAYFYWRLLDLFGSVKIVTELDATPPQLGRAEVFRFIEQELLDILAIEEVSATMDLSNSALEDGDNPYQLSTYAVLGILAKLYLNAEVYTGTAEYELAEIAAAYVIDSGQYQLCGEGCSVSNWGKRIGVPSDPQRLEGYAAVFAPNNDRNREHIFSVQYDGTSAWGMNFSQMNLHPASQLSWSLEAQPWNGYATLEEFYNSYEAQDKRREASFLVGPQLDFGGSAILDYQSDDEDIQLNYTPSINELAPNSLREAGARAKKFSFQLYGKSNMNNDFPIIRLGEMYLIRAEAKARQSGNWSIAESDVNILRARAGVDAYQGNLTEEEFLAERGREMFQETSRRTDLIRFGKYNDPWWEKPASDPFRNVFPIPQQQLLADPDLVQNPGY